MRFLCPFCNAVITVDDSALGYRTACSSCGKSVLVPSGEFDEGRVIGDFAIRSKLGEGSIGAVYKAYQISLERVVALKILAKRFENAKGVTEFLREARNAARLCHTNLVQSYAIGQEDGLCYMAMTYITGETLRARIRRDGRIPCDEALHIVQQVAEALHCAWTEAGMIHRDVKPDNIMLSEHGIVKLTDLGLAMNQSEWHADMDISGSPSYMSPEQFAGEKLDTRTDIYSLGVTLYQMLCGALPFDAETVHSIARQHFEEKPPSLTDRVPGLPARVASLVSKMMAKLPEKRFRDMDELLHEIWRIRQTTAPDRENIPEVHTISMRRLDYEFQKKALLSEQSSAPRKPEPKSGQLVYWAAIGVPVLALIILLFTVIFKDPEKTGTGPFYAAIDNDIAMFEKLASDTSLSAGELELEADRLIDKLEQHNDGSVRERALKSHILHLLKTAPPAGNTVAPGMLDQMENEINFLRAENKTLKSDMDTLRVDLDQALISVGELDSVRAELTRLRSLWADREKNIEDERIAADRKFESIRSLMLMDLSMHFCESWQKQRFVECEAMIVYGKNIFPDRAAWFEELRVVNQFGRRLNSVFQDSGTEYAGRKFGSPQLKTVISIRNGEISFSEQGAVKTMSWKEMTPDDVWMIVSARPELFPRERVTRAMFEVLRGNCGAACALKPEISALTYILDQYAVCAATRIRSMVLSQRNAAELEFSDFQRRFAGTPSYEKELARLKGLFEKK